jgi:hypothetical protein
MTETVQTDVLIVGAGPVISLSPPGRLSINPCNCLNASGISVNGAPLRRAPGLRWITPR